MDEFHRLAEVFELQFEPEQVFIGIKNCTFHKVSTEMKLILECTIINRLTMLIYVSITDFLK